MDAVQHIEAPFAVAFPLPFRVILLGGLALLCWATNLHGLQVLGVDAVAALEIRAYDYDYPTPRLTIAPQDARILVRTVYRLFYAYATWSLFGWALFRFLTHDEPALVDEYKFVPAVFGLMIVMFLVSPFNIFERHERDRFLFAVKRCFSSPLNMPIYFSDVVFADIFTSLAKVIGDVWLSFCMIIPGGSLLIFPEQEGWARLMVPCLMSIPYAVRFRQCIVEYLQPTNTNKRPLYNALKYASSFPVIFLSAAQRVVVSELMRDNGDDFENETWHGEHPLFRLWLLSVAINSLYSFWWDVTNDWGLDLLRPKSTPSKHHIPRPLILPSLQAQAQNTGVEVENGNAHTRHSSYSRQSGSEGSFSASSAGIHQRPYPWGLRPTLLYPLPAYPLAIFANLILRLTWSIKLSSHLHVHASGAVVIFWIEVAELLRRWMWVFFRVEWELVKRSADRGDYAPIIEDFELARTDYDDYKEDEMLP